MKCPNCRCVISDSAHVCLYCGYVLPSGSEKTLTVDQVPRRNRRSGGRELSGKRRPKQNSKARCSDVSAYYGDNYGSAYDKYGASRYGDYYVRGTSYNEHGDEYGDGYRTNDRYDRYSQYDRYENSGDNSVSPVFLTAVLLVLLAVLGLLGVAVWNLL